MTKKTAQVEARKIRRQYPHRTVNVVEISPRNWGIRLSDKGKRDKYRYVP